MLKGKELGSAIRQALADNGKTAADAARYFNVKPPSVSGWLSTGRISKENFDRLRVWLSKTPDAYWGAGSAPVAQAGVSQAKASDAWPFSPDLLPAQQKLMQEAIEILAAQSLEKCREIVGVMRVMGADGVAARRVKANAA